jgi:hypothetical protein
MVPTVPRRTFCCCPDGTFWSSVNTSTRKLARLLQVVSCVTLAWGLDCTPEAVVWTMPTRPGYVAGDLISVILVSGPAEQDDEIMSGLDIARNGGRLVQTAGAGRAFSEENTTVVLNIARLPECC